MDLLKELQRLFYLKFCHLSDQWKKHYLVKVLLTIWEIFLYKNNHSYNSYRFNNKFGFILVFVLSFNTKTKIKFSASWRSGNKIYFCFLFMASRPLLQDHAEFNRYLQRTFLICYSCSYYSSIIRIKELSKLLFFEYVNLMERKRQMIVLIQFEIYHTWTLVLNLFTIYHTLVTLVSLLSLDI